MQDTSAQASQTFLACVRTSGAGLPAPDAACAQARGRCEQASKACEAPRQALDECRSASEQGCMNPSGMQAAAECAQRCMANARLDGCKPEECARIGEKLQACVGKCGNPAADAEACQKKRCESQQGNYDRCTEASSRCTIPDRCWSADLPACQAGNRVLDSCLAGR